MKLLEFALPVGFVCFLILYSRIDSRLLEAPGDLFNTWKIERRLRAMTLPLEYGPHERPPSWEEYNALAEASIDRPLRPGEQKRLDFLEWWVTGED